MGFVKIKRVFRLTFEDPDLAGLEVRVRSVSMARFLELKQLAATNSPGVIEGFVENVIDWNLEEETEEGAVPVPVTVDDLMRTQEEHFVAAMVLAWFGGIAGVPAPLDRESSDGEQFPELSTLKMETLSELPTN
jgi:hypothetical protein